jgi:hypothetical protein
VLGIDGPIFGDASVEIEFALLHMITTARGIRENLDDESRCRRRLPLAARVGLANHQIRLDFGSVEPENCSRVF